MKKVFKSAAFLVATAGLIFNISCKKQLDNPINNSVAISEQNSSPSEQKILDFIDSYSKMKKGAKVEGEPVSVEDARWQWETTLNYCYGFTQSHLLNMRSDTVYVTLPKLNNYGNISYNDLIETYGTIVDAVRNIYKNIEMESKTLQFVTMSIEESNTKDSNRALITINTGSDIESTNTLSPGPWYGIPFRYGECYLWGSSGEFGTANDATAKLNEAISNYDISKLLYYVPCPNCYTYIDNIHCVLDMTGNPNNKNVFYFECDTEEEFLNYQICWTDLNKYYANYIQFGHYEGMPTNLYGRDWYYYTMVSSGGGAYLHDKYAGWHNVKIWNCTRYWRDNTNYPVPIEPETPAEY